MTYRPQASIVAALAQVAQTGNYALAQLNYQEPTSLVFWMLDNGVDVKFAKVRP